MPNSFLASSNIRSIQYRCAWKPAYSHKVKLVNAPLLKLYFNLPLFPIVFVITRALLCASGSTPSQTHTSAVWTSSFSTPSRFSLFLIFPSPFLLAPGEFRTVPVQAPVSPIEGYPVGNVPADHFQGQLWA